MTLIVHTSIRAIQHMRPGVADHYHRWRLPRSRNLTPEVGDDLLFVSENRVIGRATISDVRHGSVWFSHVTLVDEPFQHRRRDEGIYEVV
jgi:hypothetical protein